jgi:hypothetical protein
MNIEDIFEMNIYSLHKIFEIAFNFITGRVDNIGVSRDYYDFSGFITFSAISQWLENWCSTLEKIEPKHNTMNLNFERIAKTVDYGV